MSSFLEENTQNTVEKEREKLVEASNYVVRKPKGLDEILVFVRHFSPDELANVGGAVML